MKKMMAQDEFDVVSDPAIRFVRASAVNSVIGIFFPSPSTAASR